MSVHFSLLGSVRSLELMLWPVVAILGRSVSNTLGLRALTF